MYYLYPQFYPAYSNTNYFLFRQFPPVHPEKFYESANEMKYLMNDARAVLDKLATSKQFADQIMTAAQASDMEEVQRLIHTVTIASEVDISYNPNSLHLEFKKKTTDNEMECCRLLIILGWQ